ncbi:MAG: ABC-F family ATP-binding cassette domain-containing protein [Myxococcales bacterium]|nr:ABC-F family ATP-binding cassette domain-containing protein [Myxococcales bacterium]MCB9626202.1 ABC-F family ATP-binding cassette domain-containing protein [Sandaracinaceae bacterium]
MIRLDSVSKQHGRQILFLEASMGAFAGDRIGLVGPNGAGKSTVFRMIVGEEPPDSGNVVIERGVTVGYFSQNVGEMAGRSVVAETMAGAGEVSVVGAELAELEEAMADPARMDELDAIVDRFGHVQARYDELGGYSLDARAREVLAGLGFREEVMNGPVDALSGGWKMRVALARILLMRPNALLLDEPTNHLDIESIIWLESYLRAFEGALVLTSHDRAFLNGLVTKIVDIDGGELTTYTGNYDFYEQQRAIQDSQQEAQFARQQARLAKEQAFIDRFKARASHAAQVQSRVKKLEKIELIEPPRRAARTRFEFKKPPRGGDDVVRVEGISKAYGDRVIYDHFDFLVRRGERWCVMGVNGAGKSTLLKLMAGQSKADSGEVLLGASIKMGYFAQHAMETLEPNDTVVESLQRPFPTASLGQLRNLAGAFGFSGDEGDKPCRVLSGGERARVALARMLYDPPNLLILDEPTNHLDMGTKEMLVESLRDFDGTMVFVSHDRAFLSALSNRVLELTDDGPRVYTGGYDEYVAQSGHAAPGLR